VSHPLAVLLRSLQQAGLEVDAEAALDSVWLGLQMRERQETRDAAPSSQPDAPIPIPATSTPPATSTRVTEAAGTTPGRDSLIARSGHHAGAAARRTDPTAAGRTLTLARVAALPESRELVKALRPLRRRVVSPGSGILDVDTTVRRAAEEDLWFPSFASARERWLDVLMVADHGLSMILWKETIDEFERVLRNSGAFRSVRSWWLESDADPSAVTARGRGPSPATPEDLVRLTRGIGRSIVLVVSDCVGARWHDGTIPLLLGKWSERLPVALMQVTPDWFWARTALGNTVGSEFRSAVPAVVNHRYRWDARALGAGGVSSEEAKTLLRVPAITLTNDAVARLAGLVAGVGREWAPGVVFDLLWEQDDEVTQGPVKTPEERVARFRTLASGSAQRLAAGFAASPVRTLGVLRLLRRDLVPDAGPFTEAEVILGGIVRVRRAEARWDQGASLPLEFVPGVQPLLLDGAMAVDVLRVLTHAAAVARDGVGPTFTSWLENPSSGTARLDPGESPFAAAAAQVLERLGGAYAQIVKAGSRPVETPDEPGVRSATGPVKGRPHQLPVPEVFVGRAAVMQELESWLDAARPQRMATLVGPNGIGKSAIAGRVLQQWVERNPSKTAFSWCFQRDPSTGEALRALQEYIIGTEPRGEPSLAESTERALARAEPRLVILDGVDGITDSSELASVLSTAELVMSAREARVLLTTRPPLPESRIRMFLQIFEVGPLDRASVEEIVRRRLETLESEQKHPPASAPEIMEFVVTLSGGNPLVVEFALDQAILLTPAVIHQEFVFRDGDSIDPNAVPALTGMLARVRRANELRADAKALLDANDASGALEILNEVVELRNHLQSPVGKAQAFIERADANVTLGHYADAEADLSSALELNRSLSADVETVETLDRLAQVRERLGKREESVPLLEEALAIRRRIDAPAHVFTALLQLAGLESDLHLFPKALSHYQEAIALEGDVVGRGPAYLGASDVQQAMNDPAAALAAAQQAERLFDAANDSMLAEAVDRIAKLQQAAGNYGAARQALERLKELRPDAAATDERLRQLAALAASAAQAPPAQPATPPRDVLQGDERFLTVEFIVSGRVQGVGFRSFGQQEARQLGLEGETENLRDGRVRVRVMGLLSRLKQLEQRLRQGPSMSKVHEVVTTILEDSASSFSGGEHRAVVAVGLRKTGHLRPLEAAASAARSFAEWASNSQRIPRVTLYTGDDQPVTGREMSEAIKAAIDLGTVRQLIVYFAGYAVSINRGEYWLLSDAPEDPQAAVNLRGSVELARLSGIPHVVFVSDTCRVTAESINAQEMVGREIFPNVLRSERSGTVDQFFAVGEWHRGHDANDAYLEQQYGAAYTSVLLSALGGTEPSILEERDGVRYVRPRALMGYVARALPEHARSMDIRRDARQEPEARIESGPDAWLAAFAGPTRPRRDRKNDVR
jgi:acylphosphatase